jgi:hypothetical protein
MMFGSNSGVGGTNLRTRYVLGASIVGGGVDDDEGRPAADDGGQRKMRPPWYRRRRCRAILTLGALITAVCLTLWLLWSFVVWNGRARVAAERPLETVQWPLSQSTTQCIQRTRNAMALRPDDMCLDASTAAIAAGTTADDAATSAEPCYVDYVVMRNDFGEAQDMLNVWWERVAGKSVRESRLIVDDDRGSTTQSSIWTPIRVHWQDTLGTMHAALWSANRAACIQHLRTSPRG